MAGELTFTPANWHVTQTATVTGVDDQVADGPVVFNVSTAPASSGDLTFAGVDAPDVAFTNLDNDTAGVLVAAGGLQTSEAGSSSTFTVSLASRPLATVTVPFATSDPGEARVSPASLTFTPDTWSQSITVLTRPN